MVAKIASGKSIRGALNYNENKVKEGKAVLVSAFKYPKDSHYLSFSEKFQRLQYQADLNDRIRHRCVHISLNFDPTEKTLPIETLQGIAASYMKKIGFGEQPFLVYKHNDAAHPHLHIVTTSIKHDGSPIRLHNNWKDSERARKEVEDEFQLVPAQGREKKQIYSLKPVDLRKALYGKSETKASISNIVRTVVANYSFTSLAQLNAVLLQYNVIADPGEKGTRMYEKGGLVYSLVDEFKKKVGVPIKASSIYTKPTLSFLESRYQSKGSARARYEERLRMIIDSALEQGTMGRTEFIERLRTEGVHVVFRENDSGSTYGVTYVDNKTCCVFNGSDLGKSYSAKGVLERMGGGSSSSNADLRKNKDFVTQVQRDTDFKQGFRQTIAGWIKQGLMVNAKELTDGSILYSAGHYKTSTESYASLNKKMSAYFRVNGYLERSARLLHANLQEEILKAGGEISSIISDTVKDIIDAALHPVHENDYVDYRWLKKQDKSRKKRRQ